MSGGVTQVFAPHLFADAVAIITGGGSGIGLGISKALAALGAHVVLVGRRENVVADAAAAIRSSGLQAMHVACDVRSAAACEGVVKLVVDKLKAVHILVNCAAGNFLCSAQDLSFNAFKTVLDIDLLGSFNMCKAAFESLKLTRGVVVNISATLHYYSIMYQLHASAAKAGVDVLTRNLACEWGPLGVRVVGVAPGVIGGTEGFSRLGGGEGGQNEQNETLTQAVPLGRLGRSDDIAAAVAFLCSPAASYVSGHTLVVDGAQWLHHRWVSDDVYAHYRSLREEARVQSKL